MQFDIHLAFSVVSSLLVIAGYFPYLRGMFQGTIRPHAYTWLIWAITQGTATAGLWVGGGGFSVVSLSLGTVLVFSIFLFSLRFGTKNIQTSDTALLILAMVAIFVWWQLKNPVWAVFMVSAIDFVGYLPSYRKTLEEPESESITTWTLFTLSVFFAILAIPHYNLLTLPYLTMVCLADIILIVIVLIGRSRLKNKQVY